MKKIIFISLLGFMSCQPDNPQPNTSTNNGNSSDTTSPSDDGESSLLIGSIYQGGRIFYLDSMGGGLIVGRYEQYDSALGDWYEASDLCYNSTFNGYNDWYLPSLDELKLIRDNLLLNGYSSTGSWTFGVGYHWSTTIVPDQSNGHPRVWVFNLSTGDKVANEKYADWKSNLVLSVRAF